jgi:hypothetical protein
MKFNRAFKRRPLTVLIVSLAVVVALSGVLVTTAPARKIHTSPRLSPGRQALRRVGSRATPTRRIRAVPRGVRAHFAIFRRHGAQRADAMPSAVADILSTFSSLGVNPTLAQAVQTSAGSVWVAPGDNVLCVVATRPASDTPVGATCSTDSLSERGGEYLVAGHVGEPAVLAGLVPDGIANVVANRSDGATLTLPVTGNTYDTASSSQISSVDIGGSVFKMPQ